MSVTSLGSIHYAARQFFIDLATREFLLNDTVTATDYELLEAIPSATSLRSIQRWIRLFKDRELIEVRNIRVRSDHYRRVIKLSEKGKQIKVELLSRQN